MALKDIVDKIKKEVEVLLGENEKHKYFTQEHEYPDEVTAKQAFESAKQKLFDVNKWSDLPGINSTFELYDAAGNKTQATKPEVGFYIKIILPGTTIENWVEITDILEQESLAQFIVHPSSNPTEIAEENQEVQHFFGKEASSTFRVELRGNTLKACEIGLNENINNKGEESGNRALLNTLVAEGGWAGFQDLQWNKLTSYLVHNTDAKIT
jgi:hypothetical protein